MSNGKNEGTKRGCVFLSLERVWLALAMAAWELKRVSFLELSAHRIYNFYKYGLTGASLSLSPFMNSPSFAFHLHDPSLLLLSRAFRPSHVGRRKTCEALRPHIRPGKTQREVSCIAAHRPRSPLRYFMKMIPPNPHTLRDRTATPHFPGGRKVHESRSSVPKW